jgi:hypothetical protein
MKKDELQLLCGGHPYFDLPFLLQISGESRTAIDQSVKRWLAAGVLIRLRRGMYTLAEHLRRVDIPLPRLANDLYPPSYLTGAWALSFHGLIPDVAREYTSATPRRPQRFTNAFGTFSYRHLHDRLFWGFDTVRSGETAFRCATPEKALLDYWYWTRGEWTVDRMRELRLQQVDTIDITAIQPAVERVAKPRITRAYEAFCRVIGEGAS